MRSCSLESITDLTARLHDRRTARQKAMSDKEKDKRLLLPSDEFEEEASEGLGRLNREESLEDLRELRGRIERRVRKPRRIWLPAAAAVVILLVASTVYIALFRESGIPETEIALTEEPITDTALIAMAEPIRKTETKSTEPNAQVKMNGSAQDAVSNPVQTEEVRSAREEYVVAGVSKEEPIAAMEVIAEEELDEAVVVEAVPKMEKAVVYDNKEKASAYDKREKEAAAKRLDDSAAATPAPGAGMADSNAGPVGGMEEFNKWIKNNIRYPGDVVPGVRQVIVVTFKIAADSTLYDIKAEQTAGEPFTKEVFRLLREGPKWVPAVRNGVVREEEVRVSIVFR